MSGNLARCRLLQIGLEYLLYVYKRLGKYLENWVEHLFKLAIGGNTVALGLLRCIGWVWKAPVGVFEFRRGNIASSLVHLEPTKFHVQRSRKCMDRAREMENILVHGMNLPAGSGGSLHGFNRKVLFACHSSGYFHQNGYAVRTAQIANTLRNEGIEVFACTRLGYPWDLFNKDLRENVESTIYEGLTYSHKYDPKKRISGSELQYIEAYADMLASEATRHDVSVIHAFSSYLNGMAANLAASRMGILSVYEMRGLWHLSRAVKEPSYEGTDHFRYCEAMEIAAANGADQVVTLSGAMRKWCIDRGIQESKITIVPNCIEGSSAEVKDRKLRTKKSSFKVGFAGAITEYEGLDDALEVISQVRSMGYDVTLTVAGVGGYLSSIKKLCKMLTLDSSVEFLGRISRPEVLALYESLDLFIVLRKDSPLTRLVPPLKLAECVGSGVPTLITNLPPLTEILGPGTSLLIADAGDVQSLACKLIEILEHPTETSELALRLQNRIVNEYSWQTNGNRYLHAYQTSASLG